MKRSIILGAAFLWLTVVGTWAELPEPFFDRVWMYPDRIVAQKTDYIDGVNKPGRIFRSEVPKYDPPPSLYTHSDLPFHSLYINKGTIYLVDGWSDIRKASVKDLSRHENGFASLRIGGINLDVIFGSFLFATPFLPEWRRIATYQTDLRSRYTGWLRWRENLLQNDETVSMEFPEWASYLYEPIARMHVPSSLVERIGGKTVTYDTDFLRYRWILNRGAKGNSTLEMDYIDGVPPWVEAEPGDGTGVKFELEFKEPVDNVVFLNGFVDMQRKHLYKQNARMKDIRVTGDGFVRDYHLVDQVRFQEFGFPGKTSRVVVEVLSVYRGTKYEDMAISGIYVRPEIDTPPEELEKIYRSHMARVEKAWQEQQRRGGKR